MRRLAQLTVLLGAVTGMSNAAAAEPDGAERPVKLVTKPTATGVNFKVIGDAKAATEISYRLEVDGGSGGNKVRQGGRERLTPGAAKTLANVTIGTREYSAALSVEYEGKEYVINADNPSG